MLDDIFLCFFILNIFYVWFCILQSALNDQLIEAAKKGNCDEIRTLVDAGADKNCKDKVRENQDFVCFASSLISISLCLHPVIVCFVSILFLFLWIKIINLCSYSMVGLH